MSEKNAIYERLCTGCNTKFRCTAKELSTRIQTCQGALGHIVLPDCGLAPHVLEVMPK